MDIPGGWTSEQIDLLKEIYLSKSTEEIMKAIPGKSWCAIKQIAKRYVHERRKRDNEWKPHELDMIRQHYSISPKDELLDMLPNRTFYTIKACANKMGLHRKPYWTPEENQILKVHYSSSQKEHILKLLPNREWTSIYAQAEKKLGLSRSVMIHALSKIKTIDLLEWQKGYIAGLIDGEGSFLAIPQMKRNAFGFEITIANTNKAALEEIQKFVGFGKVYQDRPAPNIEYYLTRKMGYKYRIYKIGEILPIIEQIKPYLFIKKKQAIILEQMINDIIQNKLDYGKRNGYLHKASTWKLFDELKVLNMKGITDEERDDRKMQMDELKEEKRQLGLDDFEEG
jgi:hypothetical protein